MKKEGERKRYVDREIEKKEGRRKIKKRRKKLQKKEGVKLEKEIHGVSVTCTIAIYLYIGEHPQETQRRIIYIESLFKVP